MSGRELSIEHDGTFAGFLCACESSALRGPPFPEPVRAGSSPGLFEERLQAQTDRIEGARLWAGLRAAGGDAGAKAVLCAFLSELPGIDALAAEAYRRLRDGLSLDISIPACLEVEKAARRACKEAERFMGLVRFSELADGSFYSRIEPECEVLPLMAAHFAARFSPMRFAIHDTKRDRALLHEPGKRCVAVTGFGLLGRADNPDDMLSADEPEIRRLWRRYFEAIAIRERANPKLQTSKVPKKHRAFLAEFDPSNAADGTQLGDARRRAAGVPSILG